MCEATERAEGERLEKNEEREKEKMEKNNMRKDKYIKAEQQHQFFTTETSGYRHFYVL